MVVNVSGDKHSNFCSVLLLCGTVLKENISKSVICVRKEVWWKAWWNLSGICRSILRKSKKKGRLLFSIFSLNNTRTLELTLWPAHFFYCHCNGFWKYLLPKKILGLNVIAYPRELHKLSNINFCAGKMWIRIYTGCIGRTEDPTSGTSRALDSTSCYFHHSYCHVY